MKMKKPAPNHLGCRIRIWTQVNEAMSPLTSYGLNNNRCLLQRKMPFQNTLIEKLSRKRTEKRPLMNPDNTVALGVRRKRLKRIKEWMSEWGETSLKYLLVKRKEGENFVHTLKDKQSKRRVTIFFCLFVYSANNMIGSWGDRMGEDLRIRTNDRARSKGDEWKRKHW